MSFVSWQKGGEVHTPTAERKIAGQRTHLVLCPAKIEQGTCVFIGDHAKLATG